MWEGGAASFDRVDEWSDIDLQVDVEDERVDDVMELAGQVLAELSPIELQFALPQPTWHGHSQTFFWLHNAGPYLLVDFVVMKHSIPTKFLEYEIHGRARCISTNWGSRMSLRWNPQRSWARCGSAGRRCESLFHCSSL